MKKHMLKETNDMRRLMGLALLNEEMESAGKEDKKESGDLDEMKDYGDHQERDEFDDRESEVIGVDSDIAKQRLQKEDSEGEETYNYGEDEGADHKEEEHYINQKWQLKRRLKDQKIELIRKKIKKNRDEKTHVKRNK